MKNSKLRILPDLRGNLFAMLAAGVLAGPAHVPAEAAKAKAAPAARTSPAPGGSKDGEVQATVERVLKGDFAGIDTASFIVDLENRIARKPGQDAWQEAAGILHYRVGRFAEARRSLLKLRKPSAQAVRLLALTHFEVREYRKALAWFGQMRSLRNDQADWEKYCIALAYGGPRADGLKEWEAFRARHPGSDAGLEFMADYYRRPLQKEKLIPVLEKLAEKEKGRGGEAKVLLELSGLYGESSLKAVEMRQRYLQLVPEDFAAARGLGSMYEARGEIQKAVPLYLRIASRFTSDLAFNRRLADLLSKSDKEKALLFYEACRSLAPKDAGYPMAMARLHEELKHPDLALEMYKAVLDIDPAQPEAKSRMVALAGSRPQPGPWLQAMVENERKNPRDHAFQFQLAKLFLGAGDRENAYKYLQKALANSGDNGEKAGYAAILPEVATTDAQILRHFPLLQKLAEGPSPSAKAVLLAGRGYSLFKNREKAAQAYARVLRMDAKLIEGHRQPILDLYAAGNLADAARLADAYMAKDAKDEEILGLRVAALNGMNVPPARLRAAIRDLVAAEPYNDKWYLKLAELDLAAKDTAAALAHGREWTKQHPDDKRGLQFVEPLAAKAKDGDLYFAVLDNQARLDPANQAAFELKMGYFFYDQGKWSNAAEALGKLASSFPDDARFWHRLGASQARLGREGAAASLEKAYRLEPANVQYARDFGAAISGDAELKANAGVFRLLARNQPDKAERRKLARALYLNGDYGSSAREWEALLALDPAAADDDTTAGLALLRAGQTAKAKPILEKQLAANPRDVRLLATLSELYAREGNGKRRMEVMERLVQEDQSVGDYLLRLARDKEKAGQAEEALGYYSRWAFRHQEDQASLQAFHDLAEKRKDTTSLIEALRYLTQVKGGDRAYRFQLAELYFARSGETKELEQLVKANPDYRQGKLLLAWEWHAKRAFPQLASLEPFLAAESARDAALLEPLADLYAWQKKAAQAHQAYYQWLAVKRKDRDVFDKVYAYARETPGANLQAILKLGVDAFPQDGDLLAAYAAAQGTTRSALESYQALLAKDGDDEAMVEKAAELARALGDKTAAAKWAKRWTELKPLDEKPWLRLIEALNPATQKTQLADAMEGLLRLQRGNLDLILKLALLEDEVGRPDRAIGLYRNALYLAPKDKAIRDRLISLMKTKGKKQDLADVLTEIQNIDSSAHEAQYELAKLFTQKGDKAKAYAYLTAALDLSPLNQNYLRLLPHVIHAKLQIGKHFKQLKELAARPDVSRASPENADLFLLLAEGYAAQGQWEEAAAHYAIAYKLAPKPLIGDRDAVMAAYRGRNYPLAAELAGRFVEVNPDFDKEIRQVQILAYEKTSQDPAKIRKALQMLLAMDKENAGGLLRLAELDLRAKDTNAAVANIRTCLTTSPNELRAYKMLLPLTDPSVPQQRVTYVVVLEKLAQLDSASKADYLIRLADFYFGRKLYRQTSRMLSEVVELRPKDADSWYRLGQCRNHLQVGDLGVDCFRKAYGLQPANEAFAHTYAQALNTPEDFKANLKLYQFTDDRGPSLHERYGLAMAWFYNGDNGASAKAWDRYLDAAARLAARKDPESADGGTQGPGWIPEAALAYARTNQPAKALPLYRVRLDREPDNLGLLDTLCGLFAKVGDEKGRVSMLENLVRVDATFKDYQLQLAQAKEKSRDTVAAIYQYGQWAARHASDAAALKSLHRLAEGKRDTASLESALRMLTAIKGMDPEYSFQLAELQFKFTGETEPIEKLVKAHPQYHRGRVILAKEHYRRYDIPRMAPYEKALAEEAEKDRVLLGPLAELYAYQDKKAPAAKAFRDHLIWRQLVARNRASAAGAGAGAGKADEKAAALAELRQAFDKAWLYSEANKSPYLAEVLGIGNDNFPGEQPIRMALANALGKDPRALDLYKQVLDKDPSDLNALRSAAELASALGRDQEAAGLAGKWTDLEAGSLRAWQLAAEVWGRLKDKARIADALDHYSLLSPSDAGIAFRAGQAHLDADNREKALEFLIRACELKPKEGAYAAALMDLLRTSAYGFLARGETGKAVEMFALIIEREPKHKKANLYMGMWLAENRDFGAAEGMLKIGLDQSPEAKPVLAKAWRLSGDCRSAAGKYQPALDDYKRALGFDPDDKAAAVARLDAARALSRDDEIPAALADVVRLDSSNIDACLALGALRLKASDYAAAAALYRRAALSRENDPDAWARYGDALEGAKRGKEAMQAWDKAYALGDRNAYTLQGLARQHRLEGTLDKAAPALEDLVAMQPENYEACAWLAELALANGKLDRAEEMFAQASQAAPEKIEYAEGLSDIFLRRGDAESAREMLEPEKARLTPQGRTLLADAYLALGKPEAAAPLYSAALDKAPTARAVAGLAEALLARGKAADAKRLIEGSAFASDAAVRLRLGKVMLALRERAKAAEILGALAKQDPDNADYLYHLALVHYEQKQLGQALKEFKAALAKRADLAGAAFHAGLILIEQGRINDGRAYFYSLAQTVSKPDRALGLRGLGAASLAEKNPAEASEYLIQAADVFPTPVNLAEVSETQLALGNPQQAEEWAQQSLADDVDYPRGVVALAEAMLAQDRKGEARDFLKESLGRNPRSCEVHLEYQKVNLAMGNTQAIADGSRQALALCPDEPLSYFYAGVAADRTYQKKQAEEYFRYYKKLGGDQAVLPKGY